MAEELLKLYAARSVAERSRLLAATRPGSASSRRRSASRRRRTRCAPSTTSSATWRSRGRWTGWSAGDVGYGKTEVALRAAFKAVATASRWRCWCPPPCSRSSTSTPSASASRPFPVTRRAALALPQPEGAEGRSWRALARRATVDVVIGTHRLLSKDVTFKDLGLLVVDEEQRFGVTHKERLKQLRTQVDVLTLTATPDPAHAAHGAVRRARHVASSRRRRSTGCRSRRS